MNDRDILPLKVENSVVSHDTIVHVYTPEASTLHDIFEDIVLVSTSDVTIADINYDYPIWAFYSAKGMSNAGIDIDEFKYSF